MAREPRKELKGSAAKMTPTVLGVAPQQADA